MYEQPPPLREDTGGGGLIVILILVILAGLVFSGFNTFFGSSGQTLAVNDQACPNPYTVRSGDTQAAIAGRYGISEAALVEANPTLRIAFAPGLRLCLPGAAVGSNQPQGGLPPAGLPLTGAAAPQPQSVVCIDASLAPPPAAVAPAPILAAAPGPALPLTGAPAFRLASTAALPGRPIDAAYTPLTCGSPASLLMYDAGLRLTQSEYNQATLYATRLDPALLPATGLYFIQPLFQVALVGAAGQTIDQPRGPALVYFDISAENLARYRLDQMAIYTLDPQRRAWTPCPGLAQASPGAGAAARLTCPLSLYGAYGVAVVR